MDLKNLALPITLTLEMIVLGSNARTQERTVELNPLGRIDSRYSLGLIETDKKYETDKRGNLVVITGPDEIKIPETQITGDETSIRTQYSSMVLAGRIPNLTEVEKAMRNIAGEMSQNPDYLHNKFAVSFSGVDSLGRSILSAKKKEYIGNEEYEVLINAPGSIKEGKFSPSYVMTYSMKSKGERVLRNIANTHERWNLSSPEGDAVRRRVAVLYGDFGKLDLTGIRTSLNEALGKQVIPYSIKIIR